MPTLTDARAVFAEAAAAFLDLVATIPPERYDGPGLGDWDLRALVGHAGRSFVTVATYLGLPSDTVAAETASDYVALTVAFAAGDHGQILQRGVAAGQTLGDDPLGSLRASLAAAEDALDRLAGADPVVETIVGGMRVSDYLPTRTFELVVHSLDVARALGVPFEPPAAALADAVSTAAGSAVAQGRGTDLLLALTGRQDLPEDTSVVP